MLVCPSAISLSNTHLRCLTPPTEALPPRDRLALVRRLAPGGQALLALAHLRCGDTYAHCAHLAAGFGIGTATAYRYITEAVGFLVDLAPTLAEAVRIASSSGARPATSRISFRPSSACS